MSAPSIIVDKITKAYNLGTIGRHTLADELQHLWCRIRGVNPQEKMGLVGNTPKHVDKQFRALDEVSFSVNPGEVVGLIGGNGAGKSTLLKILTRITEPSSGEAFIRGRIASLLEVGTGFHPELTGRENVFMNGAILGMTRSEIAKKFDEIVAFSEVEQFIDTPVKRYSSGMYVRLAFAVAAHLESEILLVDEVLAVGDAAFQQKCLGKMRDVTRDGRTVLFVSHNMNAVRSLCTSGLYLRRGKVLSTGNAADVVDAYLHDNLMRASQSSVAERTDREGTGDVKITHLAARFDTADRCWVFTVHYETLKPIHWINPSVRITLSQIEGRSLLPFDSGCVTTLPTTWPAAGKLEVRASRDMNLAHGDYFASVGIYSQNTALDQVREALLFTVEHETAFDWKRNPYQNNTVLIAHSWKLDESN